MAMRCCWRARAFCIRSSGRFPAEGGGRRALFRVPLTVEEELIVDVLVWGSEVVRREGTRRGGWDDCADEAGERFGVVENGEASSRDPD